MPDTPRTDPGVRDYRTGLLPQVITWKQLYRMFTRPAQTEGPGYDALKKAGQFLFDTYRVFRGNCRARKQATTRSIKWLERIVTGRPGLVEHFFDAGTKNA